MINKPHTQKKLCLAESMIDTSSASYYIQRLCKHFQHKVTASWDTQQGCIKFAMGECHLTAESHSLKMQCTSEDSEGLSEIIDTMQSHFLRFNRDNLTALSWQTCNE
ncbi:MAG: DUF2218 domain-containing protein [Arenicella sp.]